MSISSYLEVLLQQKLCIKHDLFVFFKVMLPSFPSPTWLIRAINASAFSTSNLSGFLPYDWVSKPTERWFQHEVSCGVVGSRQGSPWAYRLYGVTGAHGEVYSGVTLDCSKTSWLLVDDWAGTWFPLYPRLFQAIPPSLERDKELAVLLCTHSPQGPQAYSLWKAFYPMETSLKHRGSSGNGGGDSAGAAYETAVSGQSRLAFPLSSPSSVQHSV